MISLSNQLSQLRSLLFGKGFFYWLDKSGKERVLSPETTTIAATKEGYSEAYHKGKVKKKCSRTDLSYANIQTIQECFAPPEAEAIIIRFSLQVVSCSNTLHRCSDPEITRIISGLSQAYEKVSGYKVLARRYLENLLLGVWLWRNQNTQGTEICLTDDFTGRQLIIENVQRRRWTRDFSGHEDDIDAWVEKVAKALVSPPDYMDITVEAKLKLRLAGEVWPSQTFCEGEEKSKLLATYELDGEEQVIFSRHKIGAAIYKIDDWYPGADQPIRVSAYGASRDDMTAFRHPDTGKDFFSLFKHADEYLDFLSEEKEVDEEIMKDIHFVMSSLVCGGMRQESNE